MIAPEHVTNYTLNELRKVLETGTCSRGLINEFALALDSDADGVFGILREIAILEGSQPRLSSTKPADTFRGPVLKGLWHKHHTHARHMPKNLHLELQRDGTVERIWGPYVGQKITQKMVHELVYALVKENYLNRATGGRLTGEWLIFAKTATGNYYLTLGTHLEGEKQILDRIVTYQALDQVYEHNANKKSPTSA